MLCALEQKRQHDYDLAMTVIDGVKVSARILRSASGLSRSLPAEIPKSGSENPLCCKAPTRCLPFPR